MPSVRSILAAPLLLASTPSCSGPAAATLTPRPSASAVAEDSPCVRARAARARVDGLVAGGKLDRALRVIAKANADCPAESDASAKAEGDIRSALSPKSTEAFADTPEAKAPMRATYRAAAQKEQEGSIEEAYGLYLKAWDEWHPNGQALLQAGLLAKKLGKAADAQRLFDRGIAELEARSGSTVRLEVSNGFDEAVSAVAWSVTGRIAVASGSRISILAQSSLRAIATLDTKTGERSYGDTRAIAFSPDGARLAWGGFTAAGVFDVATADAVWTSTTLGDVKALAFSPDGATIATAGHSGWTLVDAASGLALRGSPRVKDAGAGPESIAFASDGRTLATGAPDGRIRLWATSDGAQTKTLEVGGGAVGDLLFTPDGGSVVCASHDKSLRMFDIAAGRETRRLQLEGRLHQPPGLDISPDGKTVAWAVDGDERTTGLWRPAEGTTTEVRGPDQDRIRFGRAIRFSPDGRFVVFPNDNDLWVSDATTGAPVQGVTAHARSVDALSFPARGSTLAIAAGGLRRVDLPAGTLRTTRADAFAFSPTGDRVVIGWERSTTILDALASSTIAAIPHEYVQKAAFSGDGHTIAGMAGGSLWLWDAATRGDGPKLGADETEVTDLAFSPDGTRFAATFDTKATVVWDVASGAARACDGVERAHALAFSPDGATLVSAGERVLLHDAATGRLLRPLSEEQCFSAAFSPSGARIALGRGSGEVEIVDARTFESLKVIPAGGLIESVAFSSDDSLLVSGSIDGTVRIVRAPSFDPVASLRFIDGADAGYVFTEDGHIDFLGTAVEQARAFPLCRLGPHAFAFDVCAERFEARGLLGKRLAGDSSYSDP